MVGRIVKCTWISMFVISISCGTSDQVKTFYQPPLLLFTNGQGAPTSEIPNIPSREPLLRHNYNHNNNNQEQVPDDSVVLENIRRAFLPELVQQSRPVFEGCFQNEIRNRTLQYIRMDVISNEAIPQKQKYPIVLVPGYLATDFYDFIITTMDYWYGIVESLNEAGFPQVYPVTLSPFGYSSNGPIQEAVDRYERIDPEPKSYVGRSEELKQAVEKILEETGATKVNIIAHSQGSLTSRWMISNLGMASKVNALVTLSGPHRGTALTELSLGDIAPSKWLVDTVEHALTQIMGPFTYGGTEKNVNGSHVEMWSEYVTHYFNPNCLDAPGVQYFSFAAQIMDLGESSVSPYVLSPFWILHEAYATGLFLDVGPNDGLVSVESARGPWGDDENWTFVGTLVGKKVIPGTNRESKFGLFLGIDHGNLVNFPFGAIENFHFDARAFFVDLARMLNAYSH